MWSRTVAETTSHRFTIAMQVIAVITTLASALGAATLLPSPARQALGAAAMLDVRVAGPIHVAQQPMLPKLEVIRELQTPGHVSALLWTSDGTKLAAYSRLSGADLLGVHIPSPFGNLITIWDAEGQLIRQIRRPQPFFETLDTFAFVAGNTQIAAPPSIMSNDLAFSVFDIATGEVVHEVAGAYPGKPRNINAAKGLVASPDQSILAVTLGRARAQPGALYSTRDWSKLADLADAPKNAAEDPIALAFSNDGSFLGVGRPDSNVLIYDVSSRQVLRRIDAFPDIYGGTSSIAFSPDGSMIAVGTNGVARHKPPSGRTQTVSPEHPVRVFNARGGGPVAVCPEPLYTTDGLAWSTDSRFVLYITRYRKLHIWDPFAPEPSERTIDLGRAGSDSLALSPDGGTLAVGVGHNVRIFRISRISQFGSKIKYGDAMLTGGNRIRA